MKALNNGLTKRLTRLEHDFIEHESFVNALTLDDWHFEAGDGFFDAGVDPVEGVQCANSEVLESPLILVDNSSRSLSISLNTGISNRQYLGLRQQDNEETDDAENTEYSCRAADPSEEVQIKSSFEKRFSFNLPSLTTSLTTSSSHEFEGDDDQHIEESNNVRDLRSRPAQAIGALMGLASTSIKQRIRSFSMLRGSKRLVPNINDHSPDGSPARKPFIL